MRKPKGRVFPDETPGLRYGKRTVLRSEVIVQRDKKLRGLWVRCDCGREDLVVKTLLKSGKADYCRQCGARRREYTKAELKEHITDLAAEVARLRCALAEQERPMSLPAYRREWRMRRYRVSGHDRWAKLENGKA